MLTGNGEAMFVICGIVGAIIGAINGTQTKNRILTLLNIRYQTIRNEADQIILSENFV